MPRRNSGLKSFEVFQGARKGECGTNKAPAAYGLSGLCPYSHIAMLTLRPTGLSSPVCSAPTRGGNHGPGLATRTDADGAHDRIDSYQKTERLAAWSVYFHNPGDKPCLNDQTSPAVRS